MDSSICRKLNGYLLQGEIPRLIEGEAYLKKKLIRKLILSRGYRFSKIYGGWANSRPMNMNMNIHLTRGQRKFYSISLFVQFFLRTDLCPPRYD